MSIFSLNINSFEDLKLAIALAIPASSDEKWKYSNNSAAQGLKIKMEECNIANCHW